jgi:hypothetical protein
VVERLHEALVVERLHLVLVVVPMASGSMHPVVVLVLVLPAAPRGPRGGAAPPGPRGGPDGQRLHLVPVVVPMASGSTWSSWWSAPAGWFRERCLRSFQAVSQ